MKFFKKLALSALIFSLSVVAHAQSNTVPNKTLAPSLAETVLFWVTEGDASADWKAPLSLLRQEIIQTPLDVGAGNDFIVKLGDAAGANKFSVQDSASAEVFSADSDGNVDVTGTPGASVGGFASGQFHVTSPATVVNSNSVITGHSSFNGNTQLWYFGSTSSSNNDIAFINRQNGALAFLTNNAERLRITNTGVLSAPGDLDLTTGTGGVFKFGSVAIRAGLDAVEYVEMGHGGGNGFIDAVGDGGLDFRFEGATLATFTDFGHLHLKTDVDQKHTLKIITANNLNDTGIAWENSGGSFTHTIFRTDVGTNRADLVFAAGLNSNIDLLTNSFKIHGEAADEGDVEFFKKVDIVGQLTLDPAETFGNTTGIHFGASGSVGTDIYQSSDQILRVANTVAGGGIRSSNDVGWYLVNESASATNPTLIPRGTDLNSGNGSGGADMPNIIAGGVEAIRFTEASSQILITYQMQAGITCFATGGQGSATQLTSSYSVIGTVVTPGDSCKLAAATAGLQMILMNNGASSADIFPATGDDLGAGVDTAVALAAGVNITYFAIDATNWETL